MTKESHQIIGTLTAYAIGLPILPALYFSTLPDIDVKWNRGRSLLTAHRGITHHLFLFIALIVGYFLTENPFVKSAIIGYISHLFVDTFNPTGIPVWTYNKRFTFNFFSVNSLSEYIFLLLFIAGVIGYMFFTGNLTFPYEINWFLSFVLSKN